MSPRRQQQPFRVSALRVEQNSDIPLYVFGVDGRFIRRFAAVRFAERGLDGVLAGYQRDRVESHIKEIANYLAQEGSILPNAIVIAFNDSVSFVPLEGTVRSEWGTFGHLSIPNVNPGKSKPGLIVDGQQRVAALAKLDQARRFPVVVVSLSSSSEDIQREQFVLVNKSKPLPRDLLDELLPQVSAFLPKALESRRRAAIILEVLRFKRNSPFYKRIRGLGATSEGFNISQAAVLRMIQKSMRRGGVLSEFRDVDLDSPTAERAAKIVRIFFSGVKRVWPTAWEGAPRSSRLVHGVGISAMGALMNVVMKEVDADSSGAVGSVARRLTKLKRRCAWTKGQWPVLRQSWNALQNTSQDKALLTAYILKEYERPARRKRRKR